MGSINEERLEKYIQKYSTDIQDSLREIYEDVDEMNFISVIGIINLYEEPVAETIAQELCYVASFRHDFVPKAIKVIIKYRGKVAGQVAFEIGGVACERRYDLEEIIETFGEERIFNVLTMYEEPVASNLAMYLGNMITKHTNHLQEITETIAKYEGEEAKKVAQLLSFVGSCGSMTLIPEAIEMIERYENGEVEKMVEKIMKEGKEIISIGPANLYKGDEIRELIRKYKKR